MDYLVRRYRRDRARHQKVVDNIVRNGHRFKQAGFGEAPVDITQEYLSEKRAKVRELDVILASVADQSAGATSAA